MSRLALGKWKANGPHQPENHINTPNDKRNTIHTRLGSLEGTTIVAVFTHRNAAKRGAQAAGSPSLDDMLADLDSFGDTMSPTSGEMDLDFDVDGLLSPAGGDQQGKDLLADLDDELAGLDDLLN